MSGSGWKSVGWSLLHEFSYFDYKQFDLFIGYPLLAWIGVMALGYCFGSLYLLDASVRKKKLIQLGSSAIILFVAIRALNIYGDPVPWSMQDSAVKTFLSFIDAHKYPPSLIYVLMTLGPSILFLAFAEGLSGKIKEAFVTVGRVPMFYYLLHLYLIHVLAILAAVLTGYGVAPMVNFETWVTMSPALKGYGFNLWVTYGVWIFVVATLYPLCRWFDQYKRDHRHVWWLSYL